VEHGIRTIAFPSISTGAYGFPMERATQIAVREAKSFLGGNATVELVVLVCFDKNAYDTHARVVNES
jgi:O-acetyl-ADP-ribose deacetylase (regulator of RNase III)